ncbi:PQQ-binding-like beta-propeller repeat protein [Schlesneria paludicola]|uniref:PQQ-binding-like beta-propeller repeat protein n=1 Tax=Schlesneria paludicola TaxID=360056 RepID=UPI00029A1DF2|nr:PQQ-binding-like beta-propeller repeat protein [Schlesneria paludicola]
MRQLWLLTVWLLLTLDLLAGDSPQFRGPDGEGHSSETKLPLTWSESENIRWKTSIPGLGWSTPSVAGTQVWLTTATDEGKSLRVICLDRDSGRLVHEIEVFHHDDPGAIHGKNSYASPSVLIDENRLYAHFGRLGTACLDRDGTVVWKKELPYEHRHGPGGSPIIVGELLIIACDGTDVQYVTALNKHTGTEVWKTTRDGAMAYSTPLLIQVDGRPQVVSTGGEWAVSYEPTTGHEIWRFRYPSGFSNVPKPVFGQGLVYVCSGYLKPFLFAVRPDGTGNVTETHQAWKLERGAPLNPSPLLLGEELYLMADNGVATCLDAKTGQQHWQKRIGGNFSASPLFADDRIYLLDENGKTYVIAPTKEEYRELAVNELPGRTLSSIAAADESLFLRTDQAVYRIQRPR